MGSDRSEAAIVRLQKAFAETPGVRLAYHFGSRARGRARDDSDFDIAVLVDESFRGRDEGETIRGLCARLGREVSSTLLDVVLLNDAPALLRHRVLRDGVLLFESSPEARVRFSTQTIRDYQDGYIRREWFKNRRIEMVEARDEDRPWWTRRSSREGSKRCSAI